MTAFSAAAHDEGGDTTKALRARITELEDMLANLPLSAPQRLRARIQQLEKMLAAVGAGGVGPLMSRSRPDDVALPRTLVAAVINTLMDSKTDDDFQRGREEWAIERLVEAMDEQSSAVEQPPSVGQKPLFWYRPRSDGGYEGPIHNSAIERVRRLSGSWLPLYTRQQPRIEPLTDEQWLKRWTGRTGQRLQPGPERNRLLRLFRFAERAHNIGSKA